MPVIRWLALGLLLASAGSACAEHSYNPLPMTIFRPDAEALRALVRGLSDAEPHMRARCAFVIGQTRRPELAPALVPLLTAPQRDLRIWAGVGLVWLGDERGLGAARAALVGSQSWVRYYAALGLWRVGGERARAALRWATRDPDPLVAEVAQGALAGELNRPLPEPAGEANLTGADWGAIIESAAGLLVDEADAWYHVGDYPQCIRAQEAALFLDPELGWLYGVNGWLYWSMGRQTEALGAYRRWVQRSPDDWEAHFELAQHYYLNGEYAAAAGSFGRARHLGCPQIQAHMHAHAVERAEGPASALLIWRELAAADPADPIPPRQISRLQALMGRGEGGR